MPIPRIDEYGQDTAIDAERAAHLAHEAAFLCGALAWAGRCVGPDGAERPATDWERARIAVTYAADLIEHANRGLGHADQGPEVHAVRQPDRPGDPPGP